jgi:hypothetical protein
MKDQSCQVVEDPDRVLSIDAVAPLVQERIDGLNTWLAEHGPTCKSEQRHIEEGTVERVYWHYGYMVALRDALNLLKQNSQLLS